LAVKVFFAQDVQSVIPPQLYVIHGCMKRSFDQPASSNAPASKIDVCAASHNQLKWKVRRARAVLLINRAWPRLWAPLGVAALFLLISLVGLWQYMPHNVHATLLWGFGVTQACAFIPLFRVKLPSRQDALRQMEISAGLPHRPASSYHDQLTADASPATSQLWEAHRERMQRLLTRLKAGWPCPRVDQADPFALRTVLILLLTIAYVAHHDDALTRLQGAFRLAPKALASSTRLDAWITPPLYTATPPIMLMDGSHRDTGGVDIDAAKHFTVPIRSELTVRANHSGGHYTLRLKSMGGGEKLLQSLSVANKENASEFKETLTGSGTIELLDDGEAVARWTVDIIEDTQPHITMIEPPTETQRGSLRFHYTLEDDYGIVSAEALIERSAMDDDVDDEDERPPLGTVKRLGSAPIIPLTLPRSNTRKGEGQTYRDLIAHPWAGLPVTITLEARDQAGQIGLSEPQSVILPERKFTNALARAIVEQRRRLVNRPDLKEKVAAALDGLTIAPEKFIQDAKIYLAIRTAYWRLHRTMDRETLETVADLLWSIAVHIEDGNLSDAERDLRQAQDDLMRALDENAPDHVIKQKMEALRQALGRYLQNVAQNQEFDPGQQFGNQRVVTSKELDQLLKQIEDLARTGSKDAARQMLSELRDLLENTQPSKQGNNSQSREMMNALNGLSEVIAKQQKLLDETYKIQNGEEFFGGELPDDMPELQSEQGSPAERKQKYSELQERQGATENDLRHLLDKLRGLGQNPPEQLDGAAQAMNQAGKALGENEARRAVEQQGLALDKMRQGTKMLAEQMLKQMAGKGGRGGKDRDPLGRPMSDGGMANDGQVKVPEEADLQRARQILDELRRRLSERARPAGELDYIERLIERF
jgi:uncharacterized protein (TIGR02302 family)